ncbi:MAG: hypothetical protein WB621_15705 [Candidatus Acidiferrales bacterium]
MPLNKSLPLKPRYLTGILMALCSMIAACHHPTDSNFVVVRIYRDSNSNFARALDRKLYGLNNLENPLRLRWGKVIEVATMEGDYQEALAGKIAAVKPQVIILDSPADAKQLHGVPFDLETAKNACGAEGNCLAYIPPWVDGEELEATNLVFLAITKK